MIEKIDSEQIRNILEKPSSNQPDSPKIDSKNEADASLQVYYASFIEKAKQIPEPDPTAIDKARELISSGQLDTPENIQKAAENIIIFGL